MRRLALSIATSIAVLLAASPVSASVGWFRPSKVLDLDFRQPTMVVDGQGHEHIAARGDTGIWYLTDLTGNGDWASVRLTRDFRNDHGDWVSAGAPRIALDPVRDRLVVVYTRVIGDDTPSNSDVRYITFPVGPGLDRSRPQRIPGIGSTASVVVRDGVIAVAANAGPYDSTTVRYVTNASGHWTSSQLGSERVGGPSDPSLALDSHGRPVIAYVTDPPPVGDPIVWLARGSTTAGDFSSSRVARGLAPSLALTRGDQPRLAFVHADGTVFARRDASGWHLTRVMAADDSIVLRLDRDGRPHIVASTYAAVSGLWYATKQAGVWHRVRLDARIPMTISMDVALEGIWYGGRIHVAYQLGQRVWHTQSR